MGPSLTEGLWVSWLMVLGGGMVFGIAFEGKARHSLGVLTAHMPGPEHDEGEDGKGNDEGDQSLQGGAVVGDNIFKHDR